MTVLLPSPVLAATAISAGDMRSAFAAPPAAARPGCYWWWLDGLVTKEAVTRDLGEFAAKGIGEVLLVNSENFRPAEDMKGAVKLLSPAWKALGVVWTAPWRVDITDTVRLSDNRLEIDVVNLWPNRLIGDAGLPVAQRRTWTNIPIDPKAPLLPSGLLGPVILETASSIR